jgi:hypothetical protein
MYYNNIEAIFATDVEPATSLVGTNINRLKPEQ